MVGMAAGFQLLRSLQPNSTRSTLRVCCGEVKFLPGNPKRSQIFIPGGDKRTPENLCEVKGHPQKLDLKKLRCSRVAPILFLHHSSVMLHSGVSIVKVLDTLAASSSDDDFADVARMLSDQLSQGTDLSRAMSGFPLIFPKPVLSMVAAGEKSGKLVETLKLAGDWLEIRRDIRARLKAAMTYPLLVLTFAGLGSLGVTIFLLPDLLDAVSSLGGTVHWTTRILLTVSTLVCDPSAWLIFVALAGLGGMQLLAYLETEKGKRHAADVLRSLPLVGPIYRALGLTDFLATLSCMLEAGNDLLSSLCASFGASGDAALAAKLDDVRGQIQEGSSLNLALACQPDTFPKTVVGLMAVGEESGHLLQVVATLTEFYKQEADHKITLFSVALEPILLGFMSLLVAFCAVGFLMPMQGLLAGLT